MKCRYKGPTGTGVLELGDDASVQTIFDELKSKTRIQDFTLKYGPPMAMQSLDASHLTVSAKSLGLHGETLTIVPEASRPISPTLESTAELPVVQGGRDRRLKPTDQGNEQPEDVVVPWPEREGTLCECLHEHTYLAY